MAKVINYEAKVHETGDRVLLRDTGVLNITSSSGLPISYPTDF